MPGISVRKTTAGAPPLMVYKPIGLSQQILRGDVVVLSDHTNETAASTQPALRILHPLDHVSDATNTNTPYGVTAGTVVLGAFGVAVDAATANSAGFVTDTPAGVTLANGVRPAYSMPSMSRAVPTAGGTSGGHSQILVAPFVDDTIFGGKLVETTTITEELIGTVVGLSVVPASGTAVRPITYKWSTAAEAKIGVIVGVNRADPLYNVSGGGGEVYVRVHRLDMGNAAVYGYQQYWNTEDYYDQTRSFAA